MTAYRRCILKRTITMPLKHRLKSAVAQFGSAGSSNRDMASMKPLVKTVPAAGSFTCSSSKPHTLTVAFTHTGTTPTPDRVLRRFRYMKLSMTAIRRLKNSSMTIMSHGYPVTTDLLKTITTVGQIAFSCFDGEGNHVY